MRKKTVFFDDLPLVMFPVLLFYLLRGDEIRIFDFNCNLKSSKILARLINNGKIKRVFIKPNSKEHGDAIDYTEVLFDKISKKKITKIISTLYQDSETALIFKKEMVFEVFKCIYIDRFFSSFNSDGKSDRECVLIQSKSWKYEEYLKKYIPESLGLRANAIIPRWASPFRYLGYYSFWCKYYFASIGCIVILGTLSIYGRFNRKIYVKNKFRFIIPLEQNHQIKFKGERGFDFLLDNDRVNKENTLFLAGDFVNDTWMSEQVARGYHVIRKSEMYRFGKLAGFGDDLFSAKKILLLMTLVFQLTAPAAFISAFLKSLITYIKCNIILNFFSFENYIYTNNESATQIASNIFFRKYGVVSWCYLIFLVGGYPRSQKQSDFYSHRNILWAFLNPDNLVAMNNDVVLYFRLHRQSIRNYIVLGSLWSETVRTRMVYIDRSVFIKEHFSGYWTSKNKICSFFDTTFVDVEDAFANFDDCVSFYSDIFTVLYSRKDLLVIIKPSKDESFYTSPRGQWASPEKGAKIVNLMNAMKRHPRVYFAGDAGDVPSIMAVSDLVITHCMSSTTAEALGVRKKAIWYETGVKHKDLLYDNIPGLVIHGCQQLEEHIDFLLYKISDQEYDDYLEKNIKGKVESHLDGLAVTRFRDLLSANCGSSENKRITGTMAFC